DFFTQKVHPWVFDLSVRPEYRKQGIGKFLMADCKHRCRLMGFTSIGLQVLNHNSGAIGFYEDFGFKLKARSMILHL
ncbi:MAG: GNAT family N-acetyltransferase, partial [Planctomycetes bacterium]|nr:GNAT family N-acetyltransferase [Planctomycetota bacterium]